MNHSGPGQFVGVAFVVVVAAAIVALLAGYGVPVGVGALAGFILGGFAGLLGALWVARGAGRSIQLGGMSWSSAGSGPTALPADVAQFREMGELASIDLGPIRTVLTVLATAEAGGLVVQLVTAEIHHAGVRLEVDVRSSPGSLPPGFFADVAVSDDVGTRYRASGQGNGGGPGPMRYAVVIVPSTPVSARLLELRIERFLDPFPAAGRIATGPWAFRVALDPDLRA
jgi:hypothetical protein